MKATVRRLSRRAWELRWLLLAEVLATAALGYMIREVTGR